MLFESASPVPVLAPVGWRRWLGGSRRAKQRETAAGSLLALPPRAGGRITAITGDAGIRQRLLELGFTPGCEVAVLAQGPFGGPVAVSCRGAIVALRRGEAACIRVG